MSKIPERVPSEVMDTIEIISVYFTNVFYNTLYSHAFGIHSKTGQSVTDSYKQVMLEYYKSMHAQGSNWITVALTHIKFSFERDAHKVLNGISECAMNIASAMIPENFVNEMTTKQKSAVVYDCFTSVISEVMNDIATSYLRLIIDERTPANTIVVKERIMQSFLIHREVLFTKFMSIQTADSRTNADIATVRRLKTEMQAISEENMKLRESLNEYVAEAMRENELLINELRDEVAELRGQSVKDKEIIKLQSTKLTQYQESIKKLINMFKLVKSSNFSLNESAPLHESNKQQLFTQNTNTSYSFSSQPSAVTSQPSAVTSQPSAVASQPSVVTSQPSVVASQPSVVASPHSPSSSQPSVAFKSRFTKRSTVLPKNQAVVNDYEEPNVFSSTIESSANNKYNNVLSTEMFNDYDSYTQKNNNDDVVSNGSSNHSVKSLQFSTYPDQQNNDYISSPLTALQKEDDVLSTSSQHNTNRISLIDFNAD